MLTLIASLETVGTMFAVNQPRKNRCVHAEQSAAKGPRAKHEAPDAVWRYTRGVYTKIQSCQRPFPRPRQSPGTQAGEIDDIDRADT